MAPDRYSYLVGILAFARLETLNIFRSHPFRLFVPTAAVVVLLAPSLVLFAFEGHAALVAQLGVSTASLFATLLGLTAGAGALSGDREAGIRDLVLSRPVGAVSYVIGRWLGIAFAVLVSVGVLGALHLGTLPFRGSPPMGYLPLVAALALSVVSGALAAALALVFSARMRAGPAFLAGLLVFLAGHAASLLGAGGIADSARFLLPRVGALELSSQAAFGPFLPSLWLAPLLHGTLYTAFLLSLAAPLAKRNS